MNNSHEHNHNHNHTHKERKNVINRLSRIEGHVRGVKQMTIDGRDCPDILLQIAAIRKALDNTAKVIFMDHMENCLVDAVHQGNESEVIEDMKKALDNFIR
ncbi:MULTISPECIES: metal-sensing transcriptional repressor [Niallia]|uniref:metal-sensing transcriptional repressor n=1 Tax=Niallia TaxID=2837506 RepID=UPI0009D2FD6D|nr:metal-sensing transcriptional repressor [Niallia circulans]PAE10435.1 cytosolic protein [Niallia circulans]SLL36418.1 copper-sensing transcriptional repressor CsoR [Mycobacteroides abscessus subsp. abscessus]HEO8418850.1 metal-sensing transcriptional repressor [Yersinia enterocolitica]